MPSPPLPSAADGPSRVLSVLGRMPPEDRIQGRAVEQALSFINLTQLLVEGSGVAFEDPTERSPLSHTELAAFIRDLDLAGLGLRPGDRLATLVPNGSEAAVLLMSCFAKCTVVPLNPSGTSKELVADATCVKARALVAHESFMSNPDLQLTSVVAELGISLLELVPDAQKVGRFSLSVRVPQPDAGRIRSVQVLSSAKDTSLVLFTSGTSGTKKCVPYTLGTLAVGTSCIIASWDLQPCDRVLNMMPLFHIGGITRNLLGPVLSGGSACLCGSFDPIQFWDIVQQRETAITWYYAGPVMHQMILDEFKRRGLSKYEFRFIANAAGGLLPSLALDMRAAYGCTVLPGYGMTECMPISAPPLDYQLDREGTSGRSVGPELSIFDDEGKAVAPRTVGNIVVRGPPLFGGYEGNPEATEEAFFPGGWFNTGDLGWMDEDGYLYISGRSKEVINRGGEIISPFEVEEAVCAHPLVKAAIAFAVPHDMLEEGIGLAVVSHEGKPRVGLKNLQKFCKQSLAFAKWPQVLVHMPDLPRNHANKPLRVKLANRLGLKEFWGGAMKDGMLESSRTFLAGCPAPGAPLGEPIPDVRPATIDIAQLERRFLEVGGDLGVGAVVVAQRQPDQQLCACIYPEEADVEALMGRIKGMWDEWEVPLQIVAGAELPNRDSEGVIDEAHLVQLLKAGSSSLTSGSLSRSLSQTESDVLQIWEEALAKKGIEVDMDFFEAGGTSLLAGSLASKLTEKFGVRLGAMDLFTMATVEGIAAHLDTKTGEVDSENAVVQPSTISIDLDDGPADGVPLSSTRPLVLLIQALPFFIIQPLLRVVQWLLFVNIFISCSSLSESRSAAVFLLALFATSFSMSVLRPLLFITAKWCIIGRYKEGRYPIFGTYYLRWWMVNQLQELLGAGIFEKNLSMYYRLLGAKIGAGVKISKDTKVSEFDLLFIGSDVAMDSATVRPFAMDTRGCFTLRKIQIGEGSCVCAKSVIAGGATLLEGTCVGPLSSSHELCDARPENRKNCRPLRALPPLWLKMLCGWPILLVQRALTLAPVLLLMVHMATSEWYVDSFTCIQDGVEYIATPERMGYLFGFIILHRTVCPCLALAYAIVVKRCIIGAFKPTPQGEEPNVSSWQLFRPWLLARLIPDAHLCGVTKLLGRHYEAISALYRLLGVKVGRYVYWPGSGFNFAEPDLVEVGDYVVFGSRSLIFTSDANHRRQVVTLEAGSNVSDRCVVLPGTRVKTGAVLGSGALTKEGKTYEPGTYVGNRGNECVQLKKGSATASEVKETSYARAFSRRREASYTVLPEWCHIAWSTACICWACVVSKLPLVSGLMLAHLYFMDDWQSHSVASTLLVPSAFIVLMYPAALFVVLCMDIGSKWILIGRRKPGSHSWDSSSYCQRWQLYLSLAPLRSFEGHGADLLDMFRGSQYLVWYFRALGARIGKRVCLYPNGADPMMTEPELVTIQDGACIDEASLISHLNTQGVFTLNRLHVGEQCVMRSFSRLQQSAVMEPRSVLGEHTLILPADRVQEGEWRQGWPAGRGYVIATPLRKGDLPALLTTSKEEATSIKVQP